MKYEVELKFPVADVAAVETRLVELGAALGAAQAEVDVYFSHPARDFARTDEALRIRRKGRANFLTYKGPKIDAATKTRHEIDLPLPPDEEAAQAWIELLETLGFSSAGEVYKSRRKARACWQDRNIGVSLDDVEGLGTYVELELIAESDGLDAARECIASLAAKLGLAGSERRSYLELLTAIEKTDRRAD